MSRYSSHAFLAAFCVSLVTVRAKPSRLVPYEPEFYEVSEAVETPHTRWAKPLPGPRLRVLFIAPWGCQRHTVEMAQRLEMEYEVFFTTRRSSLGYREQDVRSWAWVEGLFQEEREEALHRVLPGNWDAIVVGCDWKGMPLWARHEIAEAVSRGTGLLIGYRQSGIYLDRMLAVDGVAAAPAIWAGIPLASFANLASFDAESPLASLGMFGKGRIAMLRYSGGGSGREYMTPKEETPASELDYDIYQALAIRSLLWTARREAPLQIRELGPPAWSLDQVPEALEVAVQCGKTLWRAQLDVVWRDPQGRVLARTTATQRVPSGASTLSIPAPVLPVGRAFATMRVLVDGKVAGSACLPVEVQSQLGMASIGLGQELYAADAPIAAGVEFTGTIPEKATLDLALTNAFGHVVAQDSVAVPVGAGAMPISLAVPPPLCVWHELTVKLRLDGQVLAVRRAEVFREWRRAYDDFSLVAWYGPSADAYYDRLVNQALRRAGVDTVYPSHVWGEDAAQRCVESVRAGLTVLPYICAVRMPRDGKAPPHQRAPAVTDPAYQAELVEQVRTTSRGFRPFCPSGYSLGDENYFGGSEGNELCTAPSSVAYFRNWLKSKYGTVGLLNKAWESDFAGFEQAQPVLVGDARQQGNPAPWIDFRLATEQSWTDIFALLAREIRTVDKGPLIGHEGSGNLSSFGGFDWWSMLRELDMFVPYPGRPSGGNLVRSLRNPGTMSSYWYGAYTFTSGGRRDSSMRYFPWYSLFQGFNSAWYFNTIGHANMPHEVGFAADLRPLPHFVATSAACTEIKSGFDRLLLGSRRANDGIAIYYSPVAIHANTFYKRPVTVEKEFDGMTQLLNDLGLQYDYVSYAQLADGSFGKAGYRLLILPMAEAMTEKEVAAVRAFHAAGGALLADMPPAIEDQHGRPYATQPLADLFGTQPAGNDLAFTRGRGPELAGGRGQHATLYRINGVEPLASPRVSLANADWARYKTLRHTPDGAELRQTYGGLLETTGIVPEARILTLAGESMPQVGTFRFIKGDAQFLAIMPEDFNAKEERTIPVRLVLPEAHAYDMRRGRYLGKQAQLGLELRTCEPELIALLPYTISGPRADSPSLRTGLLQWRGQVQADGAKVGDNHVVRIDLKSPSGEILLPYRRKVWTDKGLFTFSETLPRNATPGTWTLVATDIISGLQTRSWVEME
jgi:hypothetical protein